MLTSLMFWMLVVLAVGTGLLAVLVAWTAILMHRLGEARIARDGAVAAVLYAVSCGANVAAARALGEMLGQEDRLSMGAMVTFLVCQYVLHSAALSLVAPSNRHWLDPRWR